jgi:hypothetical protein
MVVMNICTHEHPVDVALSTGEIVALICADCLDRLPLGWTGDFIEIRTWGSAEPIALIPVVP